MAAPVKIKHPISRIPVEESELPDIRRKSYSPKCKTISITPRKDINTYKLNTMAFLAITIYFMASPRKQHLKTGHGTIPYDILQWLRVSASKDVEILH